ncbi:DUF4082 domain-containing protein [Microvirga thermotolerans]|uniref:DUF4082 domain-containing protein n=1 Tax=Microvirga thermotolerans TaxID=2651334 RepID=A0A5P9K5N1_9HYPH|nr:DUF4082 domain-containing protein [Microvirga thermotolerans]QFU17874.1 DUF4082 domain-containing protein [Microvirga thermotolerans]
MLWAGRHHFQFLFDRMRLSEGATPKSTDTLENATLTPDAFEDTSGHVQSYLGALSQVGNERLDVVSGGRSGRTSLHEDHTGPTPHDHDVGIAPVGHLDPLPSSLPSNPLIASPQAPDAAVDPAVYGTPSPQFSGNALPSADLLQTNRVRDTSADQSSSIPAPSSAPDQETAGWLPGGGPEARGGDPSASSTQSPILQGPVTTATASSRPSAAAAVTAAAAGNTIVLENQKQGSPVSEWGIDGTGSANIEGFATEISINRGQRVDFKINTNSTNYRIDIYRLGYYGGMGARKVATLQHSGLQTQPAPLRNAATGEVDAGNWSVSASWNIPADAVSGVYIAKLVRQDGVQGANHIPFIVRDDASTSDIIFQTSDMTWQAYNPWGGANFYGGNGPGTGVLGNGRAYAVSYNRPITTRGGALSSGPQDYIFGAEYPAIMWLEKNGYDLSYMAGVDTDRFGNLIGNHKMFLSVGHDEYWSGRQRANVEAARDAGVNLSFWSGNEVYWRTRWAPSISADATPYRTLVSYKETWSNGDIDPSNEWTGTFRDPRFVSATAVGGGVPENALTGTLFQVDSYRRDSITIGYDDANLRFWRNTSIANLQPGQFATLPAGYLGYEWDESPDNGFRPAGLITLSSTTLPVSQYLLDYGNTVGNGTATHNLTVYRAASGALVFGAGTVYWAWALDANHDNEPTPTDDRVKQAMVNLLADMGIQPGSLEAGLVPATKSTDTTKPVSTITSFGGGETVPVGQAVTISGTAADSGGGVIAAVEISTDSGQTWHRATGDENWTYSWTPTAAGTFTILTRAIDDSVNLEAPGAGRTVTVTGSSLFSSSATPAIISDPDSSALELGVKFQASVSGTVNGIRFYKSADNTGVHTGSLWSSTGTRLATVTFTNESGSGWQTALFSNPVTITPGVTYVASYHTDRGHYSATSNYFTNAVTSGPLTAPSSSASGGNGVFAYGASSLFPTNSYQATNYWVDVLFSPSSSTVNRPPVASNDSGYSTTANTALAIPATSLLANDTDPDGDPLSITGVSAPSNGTVAFNAQTNTVTFTPAAGYTGQAGFTYTVGDGRGGSSSASVSLNVTAPGSGPVSLFSPSATPAVLSDTDPSSVELGMKFQTSAAGTVSGIKFYKGSGDTGTHQGRLWTASGTLLGTVTFSNETASGWQTATFANPISLTPGATYVVSYHSNGHYASTSNFFASAATNGPLTAPSSSASGGNGVYAYGTSALFPTASYQATNYWVDVLFNPSSGGTNTAPTANNDNGFSTAQNTALTINTSSLLANDTDPDGDPLSVTGVSGATNGTATLNAQGTAVTFAPAAGYTGPAAFNYSISDGKGGTASASVSLTVTPPSSSTSVSVFSPSATPSILSSSDPNPVELGMKFQTSAAGTVSGIKFYKGSGDTGTHQGRLWTASGTLLGTVTFSNETASGWQTATFANPISLTPGTTYVVSYHSNGRYAATPNYFTSEVASGPLTALADTAANRNGVYAYGSSSLFPTNSYQKTNYWVDVVFNPQAAA